MRKNKVCIRNEKKMVDFNYYYISPLSILERNVNARTS